MLRKYSVRNYNFKLILLVIALNMIGILAIGSARESVQDKQIMGMLLGLFIMVILSLFDYSFLLNLYWIFYIMNLVLLLLVMFIGDDSNGAQRWVMIAGIRFQPSETAKILLILFYAQFIMKYREKFNTFRILSTVFLLIIPPLGLILAQPDLSTTIMVGVIFCVILFIGGISYKFILGALAVVIPSAIIFLSIVLQPDQTLIKSYQQERILAWLNPSQYATTTGYQQMNSIIAIGSGQLFGKGLNNNVISSVKNGNFISEPQTDFIFAIIGEELGFVGAVTVILLIFFITLECILVARRAKDLAGTIICSGVAAIIGFQSFLNISVATGLIPNTGLPLPFVSYGLTSLISLYIGLGFVLNVGLQSKK